MSPVLENVDLTSVSTKREAFPEGEYTVTIKGSELDEGKKTLIMKTVIEEPTELQGREFWDWINIVQNDGKKNEIGYKNIKRYLEAAFGKGSSEAESSPPDTDVLNGHQVVLYLKQTTYTDKDKQEQPKNEVKKISAV
jgi:hypothetical protein